MWRYTVDQLKIFVENGDFLQDAQACFDGKNWVTVGEVPGFVEWLSRIRAFSSGNLLVSEFSRWQWLPFVHRVIFISLVKPKMPLSQTNISFGKNKLYLSSSQKNLKLFTGLLFIRRMETIIVCVRYRGHRIWPNQNSWVSSALSQAKAKCL